ncbi:MAG TPA: aldo/keto reductase [Bryobacteraceae bacterium]|nr:aldo/keto reductase [Bryobacteraceae bacterium]
MSLSRRQFFESAAMASLAAATGHAAAPGELPTRLLGKTGVRVSVLGLGGGSRFLAYKEEEKALEALETAIDNGIRYIDTAQGYGNGVSETRVGKVMARRRKEVFLVTKIQERDPDKAMARLEESFKLLQTDRIDLVHIHSLTTADDLAVVEKKGGVLDRLLKMRDGKSVRFVGVTSHTDPSVLKTALERHDFDCTQMALNAALVGMKNGKSGMEVNPAMIPSFETIALPVALRKKMGVLAMKVFAADGIVGQAPLEKLLYYSMSLPVSACVVGMPKLDFIRQNVAMTKQFRPLPEDERRGLANALSSKNKQALDRYFRDHVDA